MRDRRGDLPAALDELVLAMLAKDADERPTAEEVYDALTPWCVDGGRAEADEEEQDPTRPFRRPLLAPPSRPTAPAPTGPPLSDAELDALEAQASVLLADGRPQEAVQRVGEALARSAHDAYAVLRLRHRWGMTLFAAGEFRRAAPVFVEVGRQYRRFLGPVNELSLDCDHDAGLAYAEVGDHDDALPLLRRFLDHASEQDDRIVGARMALIAMLAATGRGIDASAELSALRVQVVETHGADATQVRAVDRQLARLRAGMT